MTDLNLTPYIISFYLLGMLTIGGLSLATIAILFKHAERRSVAVAVSSTYGVLFFLVLLLSITIFV